MNKIRVLWLSKNEINSYQLKKLMVLFSPEEQKRLEVTSRMQIWQVTESEEEDNQVNALIWSDLSEEADIVAGIFPPVALSSLFIARGEADDGNKEFQKVRELDIITPISKVVTEVNTKATGEDGLCKKRYTLLRWQHI